LARGAKTARLFSRDEGALERLRAGFSSKTPVRRAGCLARLEGLAPAMQASLHLRVKSVGYLAAAMALNRDWLHLDCEIAQSCSTRCGAMIDL
jgi:hypothetical protein